MRLQVNRQTQQGATMVEVLITMFVLAIGLLGIAGLQLTSLQNGNNAHFRYQATLLAHEMAERMRTNPAGVEAGKYDAIALDDSFTAGTPPIAADKIYESDIAEWKGSLAQALPAGNGSITAGANNFTIRIEWTQLESNKTEGTSESVDVVVRI